MEGGVQELTCGRKERILPSFHPETTAVPDGMKEMQLHSQLGTWTRNSSERVDECQMRISEPAQLRAHHAHDRWMRRGREAPQTRHIYRVRGKQLRISSRVENVIDMLRVTRRFQPASGM